MSTLPPPFSVAETTDDNGNGNGNNDTALPLDVPATSSSSNSHHARRYSDVSVGDEPLIHDATLDDDRVRERV